MNIKHTYRSIYFSEQDSPRTFVFIDLTEVEGSEYTYSLEFLTGVHLEDNDSFDYGEFKTKEEVLAEIDDLVKDYPVHSLPEQWVHFRFHAIGTEMEQMTPEERAKWTRTVIRGIEVHMMIYGLGTAEDLSYHFDESMSQLDVKVKVNDRPTFERVMECLLPYLNIELEIEWL